MAIIGFARVNTDGQSLQARRLRRQRAALDMSVNCCASRHARSMSAFGGKADMTRT
jgi:hypothetical protein